MRLSFNIYEGSKLVQSGTYISTHNLWVLFDFILKEKGVEPLDFESDSPESSTLNGEQKMILEFMRDIFADKPHYYAFSRANQENFIESGDEFSPLERLVLGSGQNNPIDHDEAKGILDELLQIRRSVSSQSKAISNVFAEVVLALSNVSTGQVIKIEE